MTRRSRTHTRPVGDMAPQSDVVQTTAPALTDGGLAALLERATQPILAVTYWFDPEPHSDPSYPMTIRFSGRRVDTKGRTQQKDRFVQDETIEKVVPRSGPISLTARVHGINPGEWAVTVQVLGSAHPAQKARKHEQTTAPVHPPGPIARLWREWAPVVEPSKPVHTCLTPFARVPGILPGIWAAMVALGMVVALALQSLVISRDLVVGSWWLVTLGAIVVGILGAKVWYIVLYHRLAGWCIQGFVTGASVTATLLLVVLHVPIGVFLDATAPGLLVAMAVGRVGCFFAGCCGGPITGSRWGCLLYTFPSPRDSCAPLMPTSV